MSNSLGFCFCLVGQMKQNILIGLGFLIIKPLAFLYRAIGLGKAMFCVLKPPKKPQKYKLKTIVSLDLK